MFGIQRRLPIRMAIGLLVFPLLSAGLLQAQSPDERGPSTLFQWNGSAEDGGLDLDEPLATDRPDFTEASNTVGRGVLQIESGYTFIEDRAGGTTTSEHNLGELLFRYGVCTDWIELRLGVSPSHVRTSGGGVRDSSTSLQNLYVGTKLALTSQSDWLPEMALTPQMQVPVGPNPSNDFLPGVNWLYSWDLGDGWSIGGSTQWNRTIDDGGANVLETAQSIAAGYDLTDRLGLYAETYAFLPERSSSNSSEYYFNGGFTYLLSNDVQFDIRSGLGLNEAADDFFAGAGLSMRFR